MFVSVTDPSLCRRRFTSFFKRKRNTASFARRLRRAGGVADPIGVGVNRRAARCVDRSMCGRERERLVRVRLQRQPPSATISAIVHTSHFSITSPSTSFASIHLPLPLDSHCQRQPSTPRIRRNCCCLFGPPARRPDRSLAISQVYSADFMSLWRRRTALDRWTHDGRRRNLPV